MSAVTHVRHIASIVPLSLLAIIIGVAGCAGESSLKTYPVRGEIQLDGRQLPEAMVVFHPLDAELKDIPKPIAYTDPEGVFELADGAPAGKYAITVELRELKADGDVMVRDGPNLLPELYRDPQTSPLKFTVESGQNDLPIIDVKSK